MTINGVCCFKMSEIQCTGICHIRRNIGTKYEQISTLDSKVYWVIKLYMVCQI